MSEYEGLRHRPEEEAVMFQSWRELSFLHFSLPPEAVQPLLPPGLSVDTFPDATEEERAWIGLVPFRMEGIRPAWGPAMPWLSAFPETNVRTYVHREGKAPGVWFFSLDAARWLACRYARLRYRLPYFHARMWTKERGGRVTYHNRRLEPPSAHLDLCVQIGRRLDPCQPGSLEFFLIERYLLYAETSGTLFSGRVWHPPYYLRTLEVLDCTDSYVDAAGIERRAWEHTCYSKGVDVGVFSLRAVS